MPSPTERLTANLTDALGADGARKAALVMADLLLEFAQHALDRGKAFAPFTQEAATFATLSGSYVGMAETIHRIGCDATDCDFLVNLGDLLALARM
jgi:hypothetical protein